MKPNLSDETARRLLAAGALGTVAIALAFRVLWVGPQRDLLAMRRVELEQSRAEVVRARREASRLPGLEVEVERLARRRAALHRALPEPRDAAAVLRALRGIAAQSGLTMESFTLDEVRVGEQFEAWPVRLELSGGFHELVAFLDAVSRQTRIVVVDQMSIRGLAPGTRQATIGATCRATTYVLRESAQEEGASGEGGG